MIRKLLLALVATAVQAAEAQFAAVLPDSAARAFYREHAAEYAHERSIMPRTFRRVERLHGVLRLRLPNSEIKSFVDTIADDDRHRRYLYVAYLRPQRVHVIQEWFYEGGRYLAVHDLTGQTEVLPGAPIVSPDIRRFASASLDLEAGYDPNRLEVWAVDGKGLHREFAVDGKSAWGPDSVTWRSASVIRLVRTAMSPATGEMTREPRWIVRTRGRWEFSAHAP